MRLNDYLKEDMEQFERIDQNSSIILSDEEVKAVT